MKSEIRTVGRFQILGNRGLGTNPGIMGPRSCPNKKIIIDGNLKTRTNKD